MFLFNSKDLTFCDIDNLMTEVTSWDLCDHLCKNLIIKLTNYEEYIFNWITANHIYKRRAAFTLIASAAIHDKKISQDTLNLYLNLIYKNSNSEHEHIKKAASWALREIGKINYEYNEEDKKYRYSIHDDHIFLSQPASRQPNRQACIAGGAVPGTDRR